MSENDRFDGKSIETVETVLRKTRAFGIKSVTVLATASMLLSGVPTAAIAEELQEAGVIPEATQEQPVDTTETSASDDAGASTEQSAAADTSSQAPASDQESSGEQPQQAEQNQQTTQEQQPQTQTEQVATETDLALSLGNGYLVYAGQKIAAPATKVTVPTSKDVTFEAKANNGYDLKAVKLTVNGSERKLQDANGVYTVSSADLIAGAAVALETAESADTEAASDAIAITSLDDSDSTVEPTVEEKDMGSYDLLTGETKEISFAGYSDWFYSHNWTSSKSSVAVLGDGSGSYNGLTYAKFKAKSIGTTVFTDEVWECSANTSWQKVKVATLTFTVKVADPYLKISGPTTMKLGDSATFTADTNSTVISWQVEGDGKGCVGPNYLMTSDTSFTVTADSGWNFNGNTTTVQIRACYANNTCSDPFEVTITKRSFYVGEPPSFSADEEHYWVPTLYDSDTNEEVTTDVSGAYVFEYYKDGVYLGNQYDVQAKSNTADMSGDTAHSLKGAGSYTVKVISNAGWAYRAGEQTIVVPDKDDDVTYKLALDGPDTVEQFNSIDLTATLTPAKEDGTYTWSSSNEQVLTVDKNGKVTGVTEGTATVTVTWKSKDGKTVLTDTHDVTVTHVTTSTHGAEFYYLNNPAVSLDSLKGSWKWLGWGKISLAGIKDGEFPLDNGTTKRYDAQDRVVSWPDGSTGTTFAITRGSEDWNNIVKQYQSVIQNQLSDVTVRDENIKSITLVPFKLTNNNESYHVDCKVVIECQGLYNVTYNVDDPTNTSESGFVTIASTATAQEGDVTNVTDLVSDFATKYPATKTVNGVTYTLTPWCTDQALTQSVSLPYTVKKSNVNFYAKYVAGRQVIYNLDGGSLGSGTATTYKVNEGSKHTVLPEPTREGYDFAGWKVEGLDGKKTVESGAVITMPDNNVTITATWTKKTATVKVNYLWGDENSNELIESAELTDKTYYVGDTATVELEAFDGYTIKSLQNGKAVLDAGENVVNIYYYKNVTLTANDATTTYNGKSQTVEAGYTSSEDAAAFTGIKASGTATDAGTYEGKVTFADDARNTISTDGRYIVTKLTSGTLTINPNAEEVVVTVNGNTGSVKYDGKKHSVTGYTVTLPKGTALSEDDVSYIKNGGTAKAAGTNAGSYSMGLAAEDFASSNSNYSNVTFKVEQDGKLTITKRKVTLTSDSGDKNYDGKTITRRGVVVSGDGFAEGENVSQNYTWYDSENILPGDYENKFDYKLKEGTSASNYEIKSVFGTLTINRKSLNGFKVSNLEDVTYSGADQKLEPVVKDGDTVLVKDVDYTVEYSADTKNAGTVTVTIKGMGNYSGTIEKSYKITKRTVELTSNTRSWTYDGTEHSDPDVTVAGDGFVDGEVSDIKATGAVARVSEGVVNNNIVVTKNPGYRDTNYKLVVHTGQLWITARQLDADGMDVSQPENVVYNGDKQKQPVVVKDGDKVLEAGKDYELSYSDDTKNAGTVTVTIIGKGDYAGKVERTYNILPAPLTVKTESANRAYNGKELTAKGTITGFVGKEEAPLKVTGKQKKVGWSKNTYTIDWDNGTAKKANYTVSETLGALTVTETDAEIVVTTTGGIYTYDGTTHGATVAVSALPEGYSLETATSSASAKDVNNTENDGKGVKVTADNLVIRNAEGEDVTSNLKITKTDDYLLVNPAPLTVTTPDATKVYDGTALTADGSYKGLAEGDAIAFETTGNQTDTGESKNTYVIDWDNSTALKKNYTVSETVGTLTVTKQSINKEDGEDGGYKGVTVSDPENTIYDGGSHKWAPEVKDADGNPLDSKNFTVTYKRDGKVTDDFTSAGTITVVIEGTGNFTGTVTKEYTIARRKVTLASVDGSWTYDGSEHKADSVEVSGDGFAKGEGVVYRDFAVVENATDTAVENTFSYDANKSTDLHNYEVEVEYGNLSIIKASAEGGITLSAEDASKVYDGKPLVLAAAEATAKFGNGVKVEYSTDGENWTEDVNKITVTNVKDSANVQVRASSSTNYEGYVFASAKLEVTPAELTVTTESAEKTYDGAALTSNVLKIEGLVEGDSVTGKATGSQTEVGSSENTYSIEWTAADESNYTIVEKLGTLTVKAAPTPSPAPDNGDNDDDNKPDNGDNGNGGNAAPDNNSGSGGTNGGGSNGANGGAAANGGARNAATGTNNGFVNTVATALAGGYAAVTGDDAATAEAAQDEEKIYDSENPLGAFTHDERTCWVHWYMVVCCVLTLMYGAFVGLRRNTCTGRLERNLKSVIDAAAK